MHRRHHFRFLKAGRSWLEYLVSFADGEARPVEVWTLALSRYPMVLSSADDQMGFFLPAISSDFLGVVELDRIDCDLVFFRGALEDLLDLFHHW
jgi:hypothetical protein